MFTVSKTFDRVTPESAEDGEAAESGFVFEACRMTLRETLRSLRDMGGGHFQRNHDGVALYAYDAELDYRTGDSTTYALHIRGHRSNIERLIRFVEGC